MRSTPRLVIFNRVVNPVVRRLLRSRFHGRLGRSVALLTYRGTVTGREITIPVQYAQDPDGRYVIVPGEPEHKTWWRNLRAPARVRLLVAGREVVGTAGVVAGHAEREAILPIYARRFPASARVMGLRKGPEGTSPRKDVARAARDTIVVLVQPEL